MTEPGLLVRLWHAYMALLFASLIASAAMFGPMGVIVSPIAMLYAGLTALPLYALASAVYRPSWITAALIGALCTSPPLILALVRYQPFDLAYYAAGVAKLVLPGAAGGLVFHGVFTAATRPRFAEDPI